VRGAYRPFAARCELLADLLVRVAERKEIEDVALTIADRFERRLPVRDDELRSQLGIDVTLAGRDLADRLDSTRCQTLAWHVTCAPAVIACRTDVRWVCD
jgi:hypothetical protein